MSMLEEVKKILDETLELGGRSETWSADTALLGSVPELSSLAVVNVLLALEQRLGVYIADDEVDAEVFATLGSLSAFVEAKVAPVAGIA